MGLTREKLLLIRGLDLSTYLSSMNNQQFDAYCRLLISFAETFSTTEAVLKNALSTAQTDVFTDTLTKVQRMLKDIHATGLALSCIRLMDEISSHKQNLVEAHLVYLLAEISALSIDVQIAKAEDQDVSTPAPPAPPAAAVQTDAAHAVSGARQKCILGVDDISVLLLNLKSVFQYTEYKFIGVTSGEAALYYTQKHTPDLFILDIEMPEMSGYELLQQLRQRGQRAPAIYLTGNATVEYVQKALKLGVKDFLVKPINAEHVMEKVKKYLG